ncbi:MAG: class I SAM-dependent methyltransferase, partial [Anaerolineales bacterium]|nr:class I SAM-dependent methyltransferase [Anaerolineales bacterium]
MSNYTDQSYLRSSQYRNSSNLSARALLHKKYSTNPETWTSWVFNHLALPGSCRILEVGCGPGYLWQENQQRISPGWEIVLSDLSPGMLEEAKNILGENFGVYYSAIDTQQIPFADNSFEAVIANHMLYHVPFIEQA